MGSQPRRQAKCFSLRGRRARRRRGLRRADCCGRRLPGVRHEKCRMRPLPLRPSRRQELRPTSRALSWCFLAPQGGRTGHLAAVRLQCFSMWDPSALREDERVSLLRRAPVFAKASTRTAPTSSRKYLPPPSTTPWMQLEPRPSPVLSHSQRQAPMILFWHSAPFKAALAGSLSRNRVLTLAAAKVAATGGA